MTSTPLQTRGEPSYLETSTKRQKGMNWISYFWLYSIMVVTFFPQPGWSQTEPYTKELSSKLPATKEKYNVEPHRDKNRRFSIVTITRGLEPDIIKAVPNADGPALAQVVKRVIVWWLNPRRDLRKGDRIELVWEPQTDGGPLVLAIWFKSLKLRAEKVAVFHKSEDQLYRRWVDPTTGFEVPKRFRYSPVKTYEQITSLLNDGRGHKGIDFKAPTGTPIIAPFSGKIVGINWSRRRNGRCVKLRNEKMGWEASFLHLSRVRRGLRVGRFIKRGQKLGEVGNTGRSFAPHLHYQLEKNGRVLDPLRVQRTWRAKLSKLEQERSQEFLQSLKSWRVERN